MSSRDRYRHDDYHRSSKRYRDDRDSDYYYHESRRRYDDRRSEHGGYSRSDYSRRYDYDSYSVSHRSEGSYGSRRADSRRRERRNSSPERLKIDDGNFSLEDEIKKLDHTVGVSQLNPKVRSRDLKDFFEYHNAGRVRDARIVRDQRTNVSKGIGYVEFYELDSIERALALSGRSILGYPCIVQKTDAEKQLMIHQMQNGALTKTKDIAAAKDLKMRRLLVENIHPEFSKDDVKEIFEPFGAIDNIELGRASNGTGSANILFNIPACAKAAYQAMNGSDMGGYTLRVGWTQSVRKSKGEAIVAEADDLEEHDEDADIRKMSRAELMQRFARKDIENTGNEQNSQDGIDNGTDVQQQASRNMLLKYMFDPSEESGETWDKDLEEDVMEECSAFGKVDHIKVDKESRDGIVSLRFEDSAACAKAVEKLNGRWFAEKQIEAKFIADEEYFEMFPELK